LALELAKSHDGVIINADSMQLYEDLRIVSARPSAEDLDKVPHHLYGHVPPATAYSTGIWLNEAAEAIAGISARGAIPVVVGGTGLYFRALTGGLSDMPAIPGPYGKNCAPGWRRRASRRCIANLPGSIR
jgi:tRNA dimethylallyltransferase